MSHLRLYVVTDVSHHAVIARSVRIDIVNAGTSAQHMPFYTLTEANLRRRSSGRRP
jgi:hypothetical protein